MAHTTRTLLTEVEETVRGDHEGNSERFQVLFDASLDRHHSPPLLDGVFKGFMDTNQFRGKNYSLNDILAIQGKRYFKFEHLSIPYLATVAAREYYDKDHVTIKLCNEGFAYLPKAGKLLTRHRCEGCWVELPAPVVFQQFRFLRQFTSPLYSKATVFYNYTQERIDLKLFPKEEATPVLEITYEKGFPYMDDLCTPEFF